MRVANLMFGAGHGGLEQAVVDYGEALASRGHQVTAFVREGAAIVPALAASGLPYVEMRLGSRLNPLPRLRLQRALADFDVAILHGNRAARLTRRVRDTPLIAVAHSRFFEAMPHFAAIIALSREIAQGLQDMPVVVSVIPNMVRMPAMAPRVAFRAPPVIGAMGRLAQEKGMDLLLAAMADLKRRGIAFRAVIGGSGGLEAALRCQAAALGLQEHVEWRGWIRDKAVFFHEIDVFCLPSRSESFSITLIEAMAHGCPSVATRCGGPSEILADGETGLLCDPSSPALAESLARMLLDESAAGLMGKEARAHASAHYALPVVAEELDALLRSVALPGAGGETM